MLQTQGEKLLYTLQMKSVHNAKELPLTAMPIRHGERKFKEYLSLLSESPWFPCRKKTRIQSVHTLRDGQSRSLLDVPHQLLARILWVKGRWSESSILVTELCKHVAHCCPTDSTNGNPQQSGNHQSKHRISGTAGLPESPRLRSGSSNLFVIQS